MTYPAIRKAVGHPGTARLPTGWEAARARLEGLPGGELNIAHEAVDRHVEAGHGAQTALIWLGREGERRVLTYPDLAADAARLAHVLRARGIGVGERMGALLVHATVKALAKVPELNGRFEAKPFAPSQIVNCGLAVAMRGGGLIAPAILEAQNMDPDAIMDAMRDIVARTRTGRLRNSEITQGTITISSLGETGVDALIGVIYPPQVALVGFGAPRVRPMVHDGSVQPRLAVNVILMAGRAAEEIRFAEVSTGAADDLVRATDIARQIVTRFGMHETLGQAVLEQDRGGYLGADRMSFTPRDHSEATAREVDLALRGLLDAAFQRALGLIKSCLDDLAAGAKLLMEHETVTPADFPPLRPQEALAA